MLGIQGLDYNGHVYEMFGNSKHYSVQPPLLYKPAEMTNKPLTAKYFIYDVCALNGKYKQIFTFYCEKVQRVQVSYVPG